MSTAFSQARGRLMATPVLPGAAASDASVPGPYALRWRNSCLTTRRASLYVGVRLPNLAAPGKSYHTIYGGLGTHGALGQI